mgnify:CR=1 FL=1
MLMVSVDVFGEIGARSFCVLDFDNKKPKTRSMENKIDCLRRLTQELKEKYGKDGEVKIEVLNEIFDCGAWFGVEALTETMEKRAAARENEQIDRTKLS